jgi:hypothetical protein
VGQAFKNGDGRVSVDAPGALDLQGLPGELIDDVQELQDVSVGGLVELEVKRPHVIGALRAQPVRGDRRLAEPLALSALLRDPQALLAPHALHSLAVDQPALPEQLRVGASITPPRALPG